ncbi:hypothetical protein K8R32_04125 [bacterium]|nr:hypothetical protein [bacterium]
MPNYIVDPPVRTREGLVIEVPMEWAGIKIVFIKKNKKVFRKDYQDKNRPNIPQEIYGKMVKQAYGVFSQGAKSRQKLRKRKTPKNTIDKKRHDRFARDRLDFLKRFRVYIKPDGSLVIMRTEDDADIELPYQDIDAAIRAQSHIINGYMDDTNKLSEIYRLQTVENTLVDSNLLFLNWLKAGVKEKEDIEKRINEALLDLDFCRNELKIATADQLLEIYAMEDILGRENPGALAARTIAGKTQIKKRQSRVRNIVAFTAARKQTLIFEKTQMELNIISARFKLNFILSSVDAFFRNKSAFNKRVNQVLYLLQSVWINPHFLSARKAMILIENAKKDNPITNIGLALDFLKK